jgi:two-component system LytT family sensor kinase
MRAREHQYSITNDWRIWGSIIIFLTVLVVANIAFNNVVALGAGREMSISDNLDMYFRIWLGRVSIVPIVWWCASLAKFGTPWPRIIGMQMMGLCLAIAVHTVIATPGVERLADYLSWETIDQTRQYIWIDVYSYWAVVGVFYALHYHAEMLSRAAEAVELETSLTEARLHALRSQLNPHFLFNTLNSISVLAQGGNRQLVTEMVEQLSHLLRRALDDDAPNIIPLVDELDFVNGYLNLQQIRYSDRLTVHRHIDDRALAALVPSMILQPIIENAIKHGVSACVGAATVTISATRSGDTLTLQVSDSGPGFTERPAQGRERGIGLRNTEERLQQHYGPSARIEYGAASGATVTIQIPYREAAVAPPSRVA